MNQQEQQYLEKIIERYQTKEEGKLEELKKLDKKVKKPTVIFAYVFGSISTLILGFGMCVAMEVILPGMMWLGIIIGVIGILLCVVNYFIYKKMLQYRKNKYSSQILNLSQELLNEQSEKIAREESYEAMDFKV